MSRDCLRALALFFSFRCLSKGESFRSGYDKSSYDILWRPATLLVKYAVKHAVNHAVNHTANHTVKARLRLASYVRVASPDKVFPLKLTPKLAPEPRLSKVSCKSRRRRSVRS
jgi:hypothetical protein